MRFQTNSIITIKNVANKYITIDHTPTSQPSSTPADNQQHSQSQYLIGITSLQCLHFPRKNNQPNTGKFSNQDRLVLHFGQCDPGKLHHKVIFSFFIQEAYINGVL